MHRIPCPIRSVRRPHVELDPALKHVPELLTEFQHAISIVEHTIKMGQAANEVIEGDSLRLALAVFAAIEGVFALPAVEAIPLQLLVSQMKEIVVLGLRPRVKGQSKTH